MFINLLAEILKVMLVECHTTLVQAALSGSSRAVGTWDSGSSLVVRIWDSVPDLNRAGVL